MADEPWMEADIQNWDEDTLEQFTQEIEDYIPLRDSGLQDTKIPSANILVLGSVGTGKSSFYNTINSYFKGRLAIRARAGSSDTSLTKSFDVYSVQGKNRKGNLRFRICDCRGLEDSNGMQTRDIEAMLDGNITSGYVFNPTSYIAEDNPKYKKSPGLADRIHCVLFVVDATSPPDMVMTTKVHQQVKELQECMNKRRIPQLVLLTKIDTLCPTVVKDLPRVFEEQQVKQMAEKVADSLGLPLYCILPMQNLANTQRMSRDISILALYNLRQMLRAADDFLENHLPDLLMSDLSIKSSSDYVASFD